MSMYTELLRLALAQSNAATRPPAGTGQLVERLEQARLQLARARDELPPSASRANDWTAELIVHDVALVQLCEHLGIAQCLTEPGAPPTERDRLIAALSEHKIELG